MSHHHTHMSHHHTCPGKCKDCIKSEDYSQAMILYIKVRSLNFPYTYTDDDDDDDDNDDEIKNQASTLWSGSRRLLRVARGLGVYVLTFFF